MSCTAFPTEVYWYPNRKHLSWLRWKVFADVMWCRRGPKSTEQSRTTGILWTQTQTCTEGGPCEEIPRMEGETLWALKPEAREHLGPSEAGRGQDRPSLKVSRESPHWRFDFRLPASQTVGLHCCDSPICLCTFPWQSQETNSPHQSWPCFCNSLHSSPMHRLPYMALTIRHLPLLPFELFANTRSCVNCSHFLPFVEGCSMKLADIKCFALGAHCWETDGTGTQEFSDAQDRIFKLHFPNLSRTLGNWWHSTASKSCLSPYSPSQYIPFRTNKKNIKSVYNKCTWRLDLPWGWLHAF